ncbi:hypothetical protein GLOIN_2v1480811 [Rhizophagus clarus]|uniref:Uncharacterized protein n=1 Tax=Rhizophagus clarus TaxID=94130 RepID=A0A8H3QBK9_9GLOM|nr:hypothetical protein GLOIN_2v1480811 [Rhizophagus clarus]
MDQGGNQEGEYIDRHARKTGKHMKIWGARLCRRWTEIIGEECDLPKNLKECQRLHHDLLQADDEVFESQPTMQDEIQEDDLEAGPGPTTQAHKEMQRNEQTPITQETDIVFVERSHDPARQHNNLRNITVWEGKVPSSNNPKYAFNKQQAEQTKYADAPYMPQLIEASREAITGVLQEELRRKDQIKTALVVNATYINYKYKGKGDPTDKANYETKELNTYHRGKMGVLLSEKDID